MFVFLVAYTPQKKKKRNLPRWANQKVNQLKPVQSQVTEVQSWPPNKLQEANPLVSICNGKIINPRFRHQGHVGFVSKWGGIGFLWGPTTSGSPLKQKREKRHWPRLLTGNHPLAETSLPPPSPAVDAEAPLDPRLVRLN